jgi:histidinol dehydrogenase
MPEKYGSIAKVYVSPDGEIDNNSPSSILANPKYITEFVALVDGLKDKPSSEVQKELVTRVARTKHSERITEALTGIQSACVLVDSTEHAIDVANAYAAEHLEIQTKNSEKDAQKIRNAGAVFIGRFSPVSLGDYSAGSNHVLPTGGCACHSSGLSVQTFLRGLHFIEYNEGAFTQILPTVITLANSEDLPAHGEAMSVRLENKSSS